ncbi:MAG: phosphodiester glycosidase family protein [Deltaproteobacteria bacterium]|nr:MAG: phosphodiester glycosidase family protein [Deltaproteobacteria bacterium]
MNPFGHDTAPMTMLLRRCAVAMVVLLVACGGTGEDTAPSTDTPRPSDSAAASGPVSNATDSTVVSELDTEAPDTSVRAGSTPAPTASEPPRQDHRFGPPVEWDGGVQTVTELFEGVRLVRRSQREPRPLRIHIVQIDPGAPGISFLVTPPNGPDLPRETTSQTTRAFLVEHELQLAINAHFFAPWPAEDDYAELRGLAVSDGEPYSPFRPNWRQAFVITDDGDAMIVEHDQAEDVGHGTNPPVHVVQAVGTNERILRDGVNTATWDELHPRTAIGVTTDGLVVFLVADGRQERVSEGLTTPEVADILLEFGVTDAINMDGGGSSTLVVADDEARVVNRPVGYLFAGTERRNGSNLGLRAAPLGQPAPP